VAGSSERVFVGVDLGWFGKPSGLAAIHKTKTEFVLRAVARLEGAPAILAWIDQQTAGASDVVIGVDAPLVICFAAGIRPR